MAARSARAAVWALAAAGPALAGLRSAPAQCGQLQCAAHQYCSQMVNLCQPCADICQPGGNNYQQATCEADCQDYLHDMMYQTKSDERNVSAAMLRLEGDLYRLTVMVGVMFCLFIVCFIGLTLYACSSYRAACRRRKTSDVESNSIELKKIGAKIANGTAPRGRPVIAPKASTVPQCTLGRQGAALLTGGKPSDEAAKAARTRHPSEDTCPGEYNAVYENPALVATPPLAAGDATGATPAAAAGAGRSPDLSRWPASPAASSARTESTRLPREVDITDMSPARTVLAM